MDLLQAKSVDRLQQSALHHQLPAASPVRRPSFESTLRLKALSNTKEFQPTLSMKAKVIANEIVDDFRRFVALVSTASNSQNRQCKYNGHILPTTGYYKSKLQCSDCGATVTSYAELRETDKTAAMYKNRTAGCGEMVDYWVDEASVKPSQYDRLKSKAR